LHCYDRDQVLQLGVAETNIAILNIDTGRR